MKILFVVMPYEGEVRDRVTSKFYKNEAVKYMPLGVLSVAACLSQHEVTILDTASLGLNLQDTIDHIEDIRPDILGLSVVTYRAWAMTEILKRTSSAPIKVVGGPHATFNSQEILKQGADAVFVGDAEKTFPEWMANGCPPGIFQGQPVDLDELPFPARHLVDLKDYETLPNADLMFDVGRLRLPMYSSKGCPLKCIYCDVQQKTFNFKSPERCVLEFQELTGMGATSIHILDDAFNIKKDRIVTMAHLIRKADIDVDWSARGTVETRSEVIEALGRAGCKRLHVGIEHLDNEVLGYFKKAQRFDNISRFCKLASENQIDVLGYFIIGAPMETDQYRRDLPSMIRDLGIKLPYFNVLSPLAETPYYFDLLKEGKLDRDYWKEFSENPVKDFEMPSPRSLAEDTELQATVDEYVSYFKREAMEVFV